MVGETTGSAGAGTNVGVGGDSAGIDGSIGVGELGICLDNIGVNVGCVVMGAVVVPGFLGCACKGSYPAVEG